MIQLHRAAAPLVALAATGLLVGCSNETVAAPVASSTTTATSGPVATPTPSETQETSPRSAPTTTRSLPAPELSELGTTFTQDGASAFAGYYIQVLNYSRNTGDVALLHSISDSGCSGCDYDIREITGYLTHGYEHVGLETRFRETWFRSWDPAIGEIQMDVTVDRPPHVIVDASGHEIEQVPGLTGETFFLWLKWIDGHWIVWEAE